VSFRTSVVDGPAVDPQGPVDRFHRVLDVLVGVGRGDDERLGEHPVPQELLEE
jgi:hypothetical protein